MTTLITHPSPGRVRMLPAVGAMATGPVCPSAHAPAPGTHMSGATHFAATVETTNDGNRWLGGDTRGTDFGPEYAIKRIAPGRLAGMT